MSINIKTEAAKFEEAASGITTAAKNLLDASTCLRMSYIIFTKENAELSEIRSNVYNRARLYSDKIMPFNQNLVQSIKEFCEDCIDEDYLHFKRILRYIVEGAKFNIQVCKFSKLFHNEIISEFMVIRDKATTLKLKMELDRFSAISPIFKSKGGQLEGDSMDTTVTNVLDPLIESISAYIDSLSKVGGFFENLFSDLNSLNRRVNSDPDDDDGRLKYIHGLITKNAGKISDSCVTYIKNIPLYDSNIRCIKDEYDENYVDEWIRKVVKKAGMLEEYVMLLDRLII